jgi:hypothetical protein
MHLSGKPPNWIPRNGLLARAVRLFRKEGHSQSEIARELRLNRRTVSRLCAGETDVETPSAAGSACAAKEIDDYLLPVEDSSAEPNAPGQTQALIVQGFVPGFFGRRRRAHCKMSFPLHAQMDGGTPL